MTWRVTGEEWAELGMIQAEPLAKFAEPMVVPRVEYLPYPLTVAYFHSIPYKGNNPR